MEENKKSNKKVIIVGVIAIVLVAVLGISFAVWNYSRTTDNQILVAGDIYMKFKENPALTIENAIPSEGPGANYYFEFTIEGKNTYSKPIWYEIDLQYGEDHGTRKTRIKDSLLKFRLVEIKDGNEQTVVDNASYNNLTNQKIWVNTIAANTRSKVEITYRLYMWISSETIIGNTSDAVYDMETWNNDVFASIKVNVSGDFNEKSIKSEIGTDVVKDTIGQPGGIIGVKDDNTSITKEDDEVREYRYSGNDGIKNYIYFNCEADAKEEDASSKCELWRIIGIFKDENGEHLKIVKNEILPESMFPDTYIVNDTTYKIKDEDGRAYYNYINGDESDRNDWSKGGLQYWLNSENDTEQNRGYLNYLKVNSKNMIEETEFYLGNSGLTYEFTGFAVPAFYYYDTTIESYIHERRNDVCDSNAIYNSYGKSNDEFGCAIWNGNQATWTGKIGLLYPSDYGFSMVESEWNTDFHAGDSWDDDRTPNISTSWLETNSNHTIGEWLLSPVSDAFNYVAVWNTSAMNGYINNPLGVRPTIYLKSNVKITSGDGTEQQPYFLSY